MTILLIADGSDKDFITVTAVYEGFPIRKYNESGRYSR